MTRIFTDKELILINSKYFHWSFLLGHWSFFLIRVIRGPLFFPSVIKRISARTAKQFSSTSQRLVGTFLRRMGRRSRRFWWDSPATDTLPCFNTLPTIFPRPSPTNFRLALPTLRR